MVIAVPRSVGLAALLPLRFGSRAKRDRVFHGDQFTTRWLLSHGPLGK